MKIRVCYKLQNTLPGLDSGSQGQVTGGSLSDALGIMFHNILFEVVNTCRRAGQLPLKLEVSTYFHAIDENGQELDLHTPRAGLADETFGEGQTTTSKMRKGECNGHRN